MNNKVNFLRGTSAEYESSTKDNDTFYYTTDDEKLYLGNKEITNGGVTIDDTLSDTSKNPVQNKVINAALNSKANLSDIPTELPANGGNADSLNGFTVPNSGLDLLGNPTASGGRPVLGAFDDSNGATAFYDIRESNGDIARLQINPYQDPVFKVYKYVASTDTWSLKTVGNADTLDGKHASDFALSTNPTIEGEIHLARSGNATRSSTLFAWEDTVRIRNAEIGSENTTYTDLIITPNGIYVDTVQDGARISYTKINDGGNADTLDGKHASEFASYQGYAPIYTGDILDIPEMGTYSCTVSGCTNLPSEIASWCYVTAFKFRDAGYKRFICVALNDVSVYPNVIWLASESNKTSDGKLLWSKANDGGNADTVDGKHASDFADNIYKGYPKEGNCNNATAQGVYTVSNNSANAPGSDFYTLIVDVAGSGAWIVQTAISASTESVAYRRTCINGNWGAWKNIADGGNADTANTAGTLATTAGNICLRNLSSGTAAATTDNCPVGAWYGQHS